MRLELTIPDQLFSEAQRIADASGISFERFVSEAVQLHLTDEQDDPEGLQLTPAQVAIIRQGQADIRAGKGLTMAQIEDRHAARKAAWLKANSH